MKKIFYAICIVALFYGCKKDSGCESVPPQNEKATIEGAMRTMNSDTFQVFNNLYYHVISPGYGPTPSQNSTVVVTYSGRFLDGTVFDEKTSPVSFPLGSVIEGWQIGIPLIRKGGRIKLIIPSSYAYGCVGSGSIPPNTVLYFDINLIDVY